MEYLDVRYVKNGWTGGYGYNFNRVKDMGLKEKSDTSTEKYWMHVNADYPITPEVMAIYSIEYEEGEEYDDLPLVVIMFWLAIVLQTIPFAIAAFYFVLCYLAFCCEVVDPADCLHR